jgi:lysozyme
MQTPETLEDRLKRHEGFSSAPYLDTTGHWTVGYGHQCPRSHLPVTEPQALAILQSDIQLARSNIFRYLPWMKSVDLVRQDVFVELAFEMGLEGLLGFHRTLTDAQDGLWVKCSTDVLLSDWAVQVKGRALELAQILRTGQPSVAPLPKL